MPRATRGKNRWQSSVLLLSLAMLAAAMAKCSEGDTDGAVILPGQAAANEAVASRPVPIITATSLLKTDLTYVDKKSAAYSRFRAWVDSAVDGEPGYAFNAADAALMFRLSNTQKYCDLAVRMVEQQVSEAETAIAAGKRPAIAGDSYLEVGPMIADLALTLDSCNATIAPSQRQRWSAYAEQSVWNVWHHNDARWGGRRYEWTGWSTANPGNNYYYSFLEATMYWALVSGNQSWIDDLNESRLPPLQTYFAKLSGGGSNEGTGYGTSQMRLFSLYRLWRDSTGKDLASTSTHARDSIAYWIHATVPTLDRFAPIGDQSRNSVPELYDYQRRLMLEARQLTDDATALDASAWWLGAISVPRMSSGFNSRYDLLAPEKSGNPPIALSYYASGTGHLFARTGWDRGAMWIAFVAGPFNESHAHQDQGSFTLFAHDWLAVTENIWTHSGIQQGTEVHNVLRFERSNRNVSQCASPAGDTVVHQCESVRSRSTMTFTPGANGAFTAVADLTPVYQGNPAVGNWQRRLDFSERKLVVRDQFQLEAGTRAIFQLNVPEQPSIDGLEVDAVRLKMRVLEPANAVISIHDWHAQDSSEFQKGFRIDVSGGDTTYVVELLEQ
jgi:hypothetical protein